MSESPYISVMKKREEARYALHAALLGFIKTYKAKFDGVYEISLQFKWNSEDESWPVMEFPTIYPVEEKDSHFKE